jgi:hypothetical protein
MVAFFDLDKKKYCFELFVCLSFLIQCIFPNIFGYYPEMSSVKKEKLKSDFFKCIRHGICSSVNLYSILSREFLHEVKEIKNK